MLRFSQLIIHGPPALRALSLATDQTKLRPNKPIKIYFSNTKAAYASKPTSEIYRAFIVLKLCTFTLLIDNNEALTKAARKLFGQKIFNLIMKSTFYGQFVGGENVLALVPTVQRMLRCGVTPIVNYGGEADLGEELLINEAIFEANHALFIESLEAANALCKEEKFTAIKFTALTTPDALLQASTLLFQIRALFEEFSTPLNSKIPQFMDSLSEDVLGYNTLLVHRRMSKQQLLEIFKQHDCVITRAETSAVFQDLTDENGEISFCKFRSSCLPYHPLYTILTKARALYPLAEEHVTAMGNLEQRVMALGAHAADLDVRILVDAEQSYFQPAIDLYTNRMMSRFNTEKAYVFNTYQNYLIDTTNKLVLDADQAISKGYKLGAKLVRGAYMEQERARSTEQGYTDPIHPNKAETNACYHNSIEIALRLLPGRHADIVIAGHNEVTIQYAVSRMEQEGIHPKTGGVFFGQLLGMCDQVTYMLGGEGYAALKVLPYGPVEVVLPYLSRRAQENKGVLLDNQRELDLYWSELKRRRFGLVRRGKRD